ncbi:MAG: efflux transporter outer membrane subunit [Proteobacteria bacterium]|nr:efflux transporter outer membrane subunit [Pseudomonadota bacterium]
MFHMKQFGLMVGGALCLAGCALGPDFESPAPPTTSSYTEKQLPCKTVKTKGAGGQAQCFISGKDIPADWWRLFHSCALNKLIERALKNSPNLQAAQAAWRQADENLRVSTASLFPFVSVQPSYQRQAFSGTQFGPQNAIDVSTFNLYNASVNVSYTLDVFGAIRRQIEASHAQADYQKFITEATFLTLTSNIVTSAITEASLRAQLQATQELIVLQEQTLQITEKKFRLGAISRLDVLAQQAQLSKTRASLSPLQKSLAETRHALSVLIGEAPSESCLPVFNLEDLTLPRDLPVSLPSALVRQRPDVRAAEETLHAASAQIGVATANLFPQITLSGAYGWSANVLPGFFNRDNAIWNILGNLVQPIIQGGALRAKRRAAIAAFEQAFAQYRQTVLQAFQNVADTLRALEIDAEDLLHETEAEDAAWKTFKLTQTQYQVGAVGYLNMLDAEREYLNARINRIQAQASRYADTAALFQALGGGWWNRPSPCEKEIK